ncbi:MAG: M23 family metallopeptidase [Candidatus Marinimicrobia bacterium]|nr:M23 family metallopeptidase [Candidatus Neomarinimicrobiota bacterium]
MNRLPIFILLFFHVFLIGQELEWPTSASRSFSSNFGENRDDHFHMGIDIKTNGTTGHPVFAVNDGYIFRMVSNFSGFGKALYLKTESGHTAVYAHLESFSPLLEKVWELQKSDKNSYIINARFSQSEFPVKKGEIIGYSGNTGSSFGPHLHFEYRDDSDSPLNPLTHGLTLPDHVTPILKEIALTPLSPDALVNASSITQSFPLFRDRDGTYLFPDTLSVFGAFGVSIKMVDKREGASNIYQIHKAELWIDNQRSFSLQYDRIPYSQTGRAKTLIQPSLHRHNFGEFQKLYRHPGHENLTIHSTDKTGINQLSPGLHHIEIRVWDVAGNKAVSKGLIAMGFPTKVQIDKIFKDEKVITFAISPKTGVTPIKEATLYTFTPFGFADQKIEILHQEQVGKELHVTIPIQSTRERIVQFICKNQTGGMAAPAHWQEDAPISDMISLIPDLRISHTDFGVLFQIETGRYTEAKVELKLANEHTFKAYPVKQIQPNVYLSDVILPQYLSNIKYVDISFMKDGQTRDVRFKYQFGLAENGKAIRVLSQDKRCSILTNKNTVYNPVAFWIDKVKKGAAVKNGFQLSPIYQLQPFELTLKDTFRVGIRYDQQYALHSGMAIYRFDQKDESWVFLPTKNDKNEHILSTTLDQCDALTIIQDLKAPIVISSFPAKGGHYKAKDMDKILVVIDDILSGIDGDEETLSLELNGQPVIFAYQPMKKEISFFLKSPLSSGPHDFSVSAIDRVGNKMTRTIPFLILD